MAQSAIAAIGATTMLDVVDWTMGLSTAALAGTLSLLTSIEGLPEIKDGGNEHEVLTYRQSRGGHPLIEEIL